MNLLFSAPNKIETYMYTWAHIPVDFNLNNKVYQFSIQYKACFELPFMVRHNISMLTFRVPFSFPPWGLTSPTGEAAA